jgi:hypothetical protein
MNQNRYTIFIVLGAIIAIMVFLAVVSGTATTFPWAWIFTRVAGLVSYVLLAVLAVTGIVQTTGLIYRWISPATSWSLHRAISSTLLVSVVVHIGALLFDHFMNLKIVDVLIPFLSPYRPLLVALGIVGFYLLLLVLLTSLYHISTHPKFWRTVHFLGMIMFGLIFLHGVLIGTDVKHGFSRVLYWLVASPVFVAVVYRLWWKYRRSVK